MRAPVRWKHAIVHSGIVLVSAYASVFNMFSSGGCKKRPASEIHVMFREQMKENHMPCWTLYLTIPKRCCFVTLNWVFEQNEKKNYFLVRNTWAQCAEVKHRSSPRRYLHFSMYNLISRYCPKAAFKTNTTHTHILTLFCCSLHEYQTYELIYLRTGTLQMCVRSHSDLQIAKTKRYPGARLFVFQLTLNVEFFVVWKQISASTDIQKCFAWMWPPFWNAPTLLVSVCETISGPSTRIYHIFLFSAPLSDPVHISNWRCVFSKHFDSLKATEKKNRSKYFVWCSKNPHKN